MISICFLPFCGLFSLFLDRIVKGKNQNNCQKSKQFESKFIPFIQGEAILGLGVTVVQPLKGFWSRGVSGALEAAM